MAAWRRACCRCRHAPDELWVPWKRHLGKCTPGGKPFCATGTPYTDAEQCICFRESLEWVPFREVDGIAIGKCKRVEVQLRPAL